MQEPDELSTQEWNDRANWRWGIYYSQQDRRLWVPKRSQWMGWTLNFAHPSAYVCLATLLLPAVIVVLLCVAASQAG